MTRTRSGTFTQRPEVSCQVKNTSRKSRTKATDPDPNVSASTSNTRSTRTKTPSVPSKRGFSEVDESYFGPSSTEAILGNSTYLDEVEGSDKEDQLFGRNCGLKTPVWKMKADLNRDDYVNNIRQALCSTAKKKQDTASRLISTPCMSTLQSRLVKRASLAAEKEMALIEQRVSAKKGNNSGNKSIFNTSTVRTPARPPSYIDLSTIRPVPMSVDANPSPGTPAFATPGSAVDSPYEIRKTPNTAGNDRHTSLLSKTATPVSTLGGAKRLTVQRASLDMSSILKGVVAYVEVRTNHDNLSQGVKSHLRTLGAQVEENFTKKVTHVIFKEGLMSTYKKAEQWRVPLVSALWIEACKSVRKIVPAEEFPPIDIERYKNALPFKRFRKKRSIQPISDVRRLPTRLTQRKRNKLATTEEEPSSAPAKGKRSIVEELNKNLNMDKQVEDKYLQTLLTLAGPFLEEALNRSDSPTNDGDLFLPLSVRLLKKYMTPRGSQTETKLARTRVSELEKHLNLNQKGRTRLRKFLVFPNEDKAETTSGNTQSDEESEGEDNSISPVELPKVFRKSAPARMLTSRKKRRKTTKNAKPTKTLITKPTVIVNKKKPQPTEDKENVNSKSTKVIPKLVTGTENKVQKPGKTNSAVKRKLLPTSQLIMLDAPVEDLSINRPMARAQPPPVESPRKKQKVLPEAKVPAASQASSQASSGSRYSEMYGLLSSDEDERNSAAWFATPRRNKPLPKPVLVCTSLHTNETEQVNCVVSKLQVFEVATKVNAQTTHIVTGGPRRTLNLVKGIARGCWIVKLSWVHDSLKAGRWLYEEPYELTEFSPAIKEVRLLRQCYKFLFSLDIFASCGSIYVCQKTVPPRDDLKEILRLCSAVVVSSSKSAKIVIGNNVAGSLNVQEKWVLDCVSQNKLIDTKSYVIRKSEIGKS